MASKFYFEIDHQGSGYTVVEEVKEWLREHVYSQLHICEHQYRCYDGYLSYWQSVTLYDETLAVHFKLLWSEHIVEEKRSSVV
jgi:hypothetical protein